MRFSKLALAIGLVTASGQSSNSTCHDYVIVETRGTFEAQGPSVGFKELVSDVLGNLTGGIEYNTVYPAAENQTYYLGSNNIVDYINSGLQNCPNQKYAVIGYSQGASATGGALYNYTDASSAGFNAIQAVVVIGNPYKIPNKDNDVDQNGGKVGVEYRGALYNESLPNEYGNGIPDIFYSSGKLLDICYINDPICAPASPNASLTNHLLYGGNTNVQNMGAKHILDRLTANNSTGNSTASGGSGGSGTSSASGNGTSSTTGGASPTSSTGIAAGVKVPVAGFAWALALMMAVMI